MKVVLGALWTLLVQLFLGLIGQPVPGQTAEDQVRNLRQGERIRAGTERAGALATLRTVTREVFLALIAQPLPRSASSKRRPRS
ncbi:hypothetical protein DAERI_010456 [Deinococcus aerius]|uniref:Uncharacterized protein n=1 Tax=Deinococcus aerius TaxID=200253 RepID=A0A2I9CRW0_9DEIO|nr:hypothetical protein [Deinococcus aerius]GBF04284.1 hypothetical protein DAERI_010456 [Deinococcus aerius]